MVPFDRPHTISCWSSIATICLCLAPFPRYYHFFPKFQTSCDPEQNYTPSKLLFSKRQRITLRLLNAIAIPSVCLSVCLLSVCRLSSVTLVHSTQAVELFGNFFHHTIAQGLYFSDAKNRRWGRPFPPEICVQSDPPPLKQRNFDQYRLIASQP